MTAAWGSRFLRRAAALEDVKRRRAREPSSYAEGSRIFEALWREARAMGVGEGADPLAGVEVDVAMVRAIRRVRTPT